MAKANREAETIELTHEEMDICFAAISDFQKDAGSVVDRAVKLKAEDGAMALVKFGKQLEELKNKFLY